MSNQSCLNCPTVLYSIINNHIDCLKCFNINELNNETYLTSSSQHKFLEIIEYLLENNCPYNEKFIKHVKLLNLTQEEQIKYPLICSYFN